MRQLREPAEKEQTQLIMERETEKRKGIDENIAKRLKEIQGKYNPQPST